MNSNDNECRNSNDNEHYNSNDNEYYNAADASTISLSSNQQLGARPMHVYYNTVDGAQIESTEL